MLGGFHDDGSAAIEIGENGEARVPLASQCVLKLESTYAFTRRGPWHLKVRHLDVVPLRYSIIFVSFYLKI